jgi:hypothetical protein
MLLISIGQQPGNMTSVDDHLKPTLSTPKAQLNTAYYARPCVTNACRPALSRRKRRFESARGYHPNSLGCVRLGRQRIALRGMSRGMAQY